LHGAVLPTVLDVTVETPDYTHLTLKVRTANQLSPSCMNYAVFKTYAPVCICSCFALLLLRARTNPSVVMNHPWLQFAIITLTFFSSRSTC